MVWERVLTWWKSVALRNPKNQIVESLGIGTQPNTLSLGTNDITLLILKQSLQITKEIILLGCSGSMFDIIGGIVIHAIEIIGTFYQGDFFICERGKTVAKLLSHGSRVFTKIDGIGEPGNTEFEFAFGGFDVLRIFWVPGVDSVTYRGISIRYGK